MLVLARCLVQTVTSFACLEFGEGATRPFRNLNIVVHSRLSTGCDFYVFLVLLILELFKGLDIERNVIHVS